MLNKPIPYKFDYSLSRESKGFGSGIKTKPYPYKLNYPIGLSHGSYRFRYDRREEVYIEKIDSRYIKPKSEIATEDIERFYVSTRSEIDIFNFKSLSLIERRQIIKNKYKTLNIILKELYKEDREYLISSIVHRLKKNSDRALSLKYRETSYVDKEFEHDLVKANDNFLKDTEYMLAKAKNLMEREDMFIFEKVKKIIINEVDKLLEKDVNHMYKENKDIKLEEHASNLECTRNKYELETKKDIDVIADENLLTQGLREIDNIDSDTLLHKLVEIVKDSYEFASFRSVDDLIKDSFKRLLFKNIDELSKDSYERLSFKDIKENLDMDILENVLFKNSDNNNVDKFINDKFFYTGGVKEAMIEEVTLLYKNLEGKDIDTYEESLWKRWYAEVEKDIMHNERFTIFYDREISLDAKKYILELMQNINIYKAFNTMNLSLQVNSHIDKSISNIRLDIVNKLIEQELESKYLSKESIGHIQNLASDMKLENLSIANIIKNEGLLQLSESISRELLKDEKLKKLKKAKAKELENTLTDITFNIIRDKKLSIEYEDKLLDKEIEKQAIKDNLETKLDIERKKNIDIDQQVILLELQRIKDCDIEEKDIELILNRVLLLDKDIKEILTTKNFEKDMSLENDEVSLIKEYTKDILVEDKETIVGVEDYKDLDVNKFDYYYRKIVPIIEKNKELLFTRRFKTIIKDIIDIVVEKVYKDVSLDIESQLEKVRTKLLEIDKFEQLLEKHITKLMFKDTKENDLDKIINILEIYIEEKNYEIDKKAIKEITNDFNNEKLLELISDILIEISNDQTLDTSSIKEILECVFIELEKNSYKEIVLDESMPLVKLHREITKSHKHLTLDKLKGLIEKEEEKVATILKELKNIVKHKEKNLDLHKRFWFLRATEPLDWKIVPYNNYPYENEPVVFDESKEMTPDNWQLEMVDVENKLFKKIDKNPIPFGEGTSNVEMALSIEIMIEMINILILLWSRLFYAFTGYTGTQSVTRLTRTLYEWLTLETSVNAMDNKESKKHYMRAYRWIRWEAEKVAIKAREDMSLNGNFYIDEFIFELIYYMENHHFDTMPLFEVVSVMDEYRALIPSDEPQGDIEFVLDKVKGMRHKILDCREKRNNE